MNPTPRQDLTGKTFGFLKAVSFVRSSHKGTWWEFECRCGKRVVKERRQVVHNGTKSCGCYRVQCGKENRTHGESHRSPEWRAWVKMRSRCEDINDISYPNYGGRGITVCERWSTFENFLADMGRKPSVTHSLDRKKNHLGYSPENCKWSTRIEQNNNKRSNVFISFGGEEKTAAQWGRETGLGGALILDRVILKRWPIEQALTLPRRPGKKLDKTAVELGKQDVEKTKIIPDKEVKIFELTPKE